MTRKEQREMWEERVSAFKSSGENVTTWCAAHDIKAHQLYYWLKKSNDVKASTKFSSSKWMAVEVDKYQKSESCIQVKVGQASVEIKPGFDHTLLVDVIRALSYDA